MALDHAKAGDAGKLWVVSKRQESGRGRRGRAWATPTGNLAATLLLVETYELQPCRHAGFCRRAGARRRARRRRAGPAHQRLDPTAAAASGKPVRAEMAERRSGRRRQTRRHPARIRAASRTTAFGAGHRHRRQRRRASRRCSLSGDIAQGAGSGLRCGNAVPGAVRRLERELAASGTTGGAAEDPRSAGFRAQPASARRLRFASTATWSAACSRRSTRIAGFVIRDGTGAIVKIAAGDVHFGAVASAGAA